MAEFAEYSQRVACTKIMPETNQPSEQDSARWRTFIDAANIFTMARHELFVHGRSSLVELIRAGLDRPGERPYALDLVPLLKEEERKQLFPDLVSLAGSYDSSMGIARNLILELPRQWVLEIVEETSEPLLRDGTYEEYRGLLQLYLELDQSLTYKLARRAAEHSDPDIKEAGDDFLEELDHQTLTDIQRLEAEWDLSSGFLGRLREGHFDPVGFQRFEQLLGSIRLDQDKPLDRRFVSLTWYIPMFMSWQRERVQALGGNVKELEVATNKIQNRLEDLLGVP